MQVLKCECILNVDKNENLLIKTPSNKPIKGVLKVLAQNLCKVRIPI